VSETANEALKDHPDHHRRRTAQYRYALPPASVCGRWRIIPRFIMGLGAARDRHFPASSPKPGARVFDFGCGPQPTVDLVSS